MVRTMLAAVLIISVAFAGCFGATDSENQVSEEENQQIGLDTEYSYEGNFEKQISGHNLPVWSSNSGSNCLIFPSGIEMVLAGNVTAVWTPDTQYSEELELYFRSGPESFSIHEQGISPLRLEFSDLTPDPDWGVTIFLKLTDPGIAVDQVFDLEVRFEYQGKENVDPTHGACG